MAEFQRLQFSIGPVQGFVAQSRRTRDLWSSSFLLSYLAAEAIKAVRNQNGKLVLPHADSLAEQNVHDFGTVPNRFVADFTDASEATLAAKRADSAVREGWKRIANEVWKQFISEVAQQHGNKTDERGGTNGIWNRQVAAFWEISWIIGAVEDSSQFLAARKNWRTTPATVEPGDHCTMMSDRQELSGWIRSVSREAREQQDTFWEALRQQKQVETLDLAKDERLCAIALIKRMFPKVAKQIIGRDLKHTNWPSTAYIAAVPWLVKVAESEKTQSLAQSYGEQVLELAKHSRGERQTRIPKLAELKQAGRTGDFLNLDGNFFQRNAIANDNVTPLEKLLPGESDEAARRRLQKRLGELCAEVEEKPSAFYALLLMDGDSMGSLLGAARTHSDAGESLASAALSQFSIAAPKIVGERLGVTIYAGGDDVLAMLPLDTALACANQLALAYRDAFRAKLNESISKQATLSGAIVYAHYHTPLRDVLKTAHHLLDDVAKDATGRDSLAVAIFKSSGITAQWAAPWEHIRDVGENAKADNIIDALVDDLTKRDGGKKNGTTTDRSAEFSSGFLYNVRERFAALTDKALTKPGEFGQLSDELTKGDLLAKVLEADYLRGLSHRGGEEVAEENRKQAAAAIQRLLALCQRVTRTKADHSITSNPECKRDHNTLGIDGALLVRFLASDGKEDTE